MDQAPVMKLRQEKRKEYLHEVNVTPLRNDVLCSENPDNCNVSKSDNVNERKTSFSKTDNNYLPPGTAAIVGDSIVKGINEKRLI